MIGGWLIEILQHVKLF